MDEHGDVQRRPQSEGDSGMAISPTLKQPNPSKRPRTTPKLRIQRVLSQQPLKSPSSTELFFMTKLTDSPPETQTNDEHLAIDTPSDSEEVEQAEEPDEESSAPENNQVGPTLIEVEQQSVEGITFFAQWQQKMDAAEAARARIQEDLVQYIGTLGTKVDDHGQVLVEFPDNYDEVLKLMTKSDVVDDSKWTKALIQDGIARKQAHGVIDGEEAPDSQLNVKIAQGIAQIRQYDTILDALDEKLKKPTKVTKPFMAVKGKSSSAQKMKDKVEAAKSIMHTDSPTVNFIERNKEMKETGSNLTKTEAKRLEDVLVDEKDDESNPFGIGDTSTIDESLKEMTQRRSSVPFLPPALPVDLNQRLAAIDAALQSYRDEDEESEYGSCIVDDPNDDTVSMRSGVSRSSSMWSRASNRTISKCDIVKVTCQAQDEIKPDEKASKEAIQKLLQGLSGITIEIMDEEIVQDVQDDKKEDTQQKTMTQHKPEPPVRLDSSSSTKHRKISSKPPTSSFTHLFTLPFEAQGPRKSLTGVQYR